MGSNIINPKDPFKEFPDDHTVKYYKALIERKYFSSTEDCDNY